MKKIKYDEHVFVCLPIKDFKLPLGKRIQIFLSGWKMKYIVPVVAIVLVTVAVVAIALFVVYWPKQEGTSTKSGKKTTYYCSFFSIFKTIGIIGKNATFF